VSYVRFLGRHSVAAACVNSTLSIWDTLAGERVRTLSGHVNVRNFVGMEANGPYISCGSETSQARPLRLAVPWGPEPIACCTGCAALVLLAICLLLTCAQAQGLQHCKDASMHC
jgi:hypothetical protein